MTVFTDSTTLFELGQCKIKKDNWDYKHPLESCLSQKCGFRVHQACKGTGVNLGINHKYI